MEGRDGGGGWWMAGAMLANGGEMVGNVGDGGAGGKREDGGSRGKGGRLSTGCRTG